jgi:transcription elongation GreA/GreB family factor
MSKRPPASRAVTEANRLFKPAQSETTETEYAKTQKAFDDNRERLKAERLAREAAGESTRKRKPSS